MVKMFWERVLLNQNFASPYETKTWAMCTISFYLKKNVFLDEKYVPSALVAVHLVKIKSNLLFSVLPSHANWATGFKDNPSNGHYPSTFMLPV